MPRFLFVLLLSLCLAPFASAEEAASRWLGTAFGALSDTDRRTVQEELSLAGLYSGRIDGQGGARTRSALLASLAFLHDNSYGRVTIPLTGPADAEAYLQALSHRAHSGYLYGEGEEGQ